MDEMIKLDVLTDEITGEICANRCGSKCCDFKLSDHFVPVEIVDYGNLARIGVENFVSFYSSLESPQLLHAIDGKCVFLKRETGLCSIYDFRPLACRNYPYRESEKEEADLPDWCELYHRSSEKLELQRIKDAEKRLNQYFEHQRDVNQDVLMEYLDLERSNTVFSIKKLELNHHISDKLLYAQFDANNQETIDFAKEKLHQIIKEKEQDWLVFYVLIYDSNFDIIGKIQAVSRNHESILPPYLEKFPPNYQEYDRLYGIIMGSNDYRANSVSGAILPDEFQLILQEKLRNKNPINSEFQ